MFDGSKRPFQPRSESSKDMQVLRSTGTLSVESGEQYQLLMAHLLLSIEIDRKDTIIRQLMTVVSNDQSHRVIQQLSLQCKKYEVEIKTLTETITMLKENISSIQTNKNRQIFTSISQYNQQYESRIAFLQNKTRKLQEEKIDLEEQIKQNKVNQTMAEFNYFKNESNERGRVRELEGQLAAERTRAESERKAHIEKNILLEELKNKVIQYENREKLIVAQYEDKFRNYHNEVIFQDNLKKSQIMSTEERLNATSQQINSLHQQIRNLKQSNEQLRQTNIVKERQITKMASEYRTLEIKLAKSETELKDINIKLQSKSQEIRMKEREFHEKIQIAQKYSKEVEQLRFTFAAKGQEAEIYEEEANRLKSQIIELQSQIESQRLQIRRLKKKSLTQAILCEGCKAREMASSGLIASQKSLKAAFNLGDIIEQTQQLFRSNKKMQSLISHHDSFLDSSIHVYNTRTGQN